MHYCTAPIHLDVHDVAQRNHLKAVANCLRSVLDVHDAHDIYTYVCTIILAPLTLMCTMLLSATISKRWPLRAKRGLTEGASASTTCVRSKQETETCTFGRVRCTTQEQEGRRGERGDNNPSTVIQAGKCPRENWVMSTANEAIMKHQSIVYFFHGCWTPGSKCRLLTIYPPLILMTSTRQAEHRAPQSEAHVMLLLGRHPSAKVCTSQCAHVTTHLLVVGVVSLHAAQGAEEVLTPTRAGGQVPHLQQCTRMRDGNTVTCTGAQSPRGTAGICWDFSAFGHTHNTTFIAQPSVAIFPLDLQTSCA
eukprot:1158605-Pelagomonas_calceolata.AAC.17